MGVRTIDSLVIEGTTIGVRIDINSPMDASGSIADDARFAAHTETLHELIDGGGRVVILAHQGRPAGQGFTTLEEHATHLGALLDHEVTYVDSTFSSSARDAIEQLDDGGVLCLENTRFYSEEYMELDPSIAARTHLVDRLSEVLDVYVNDAFACSHRSQATIVGFPQLLPSFAGRVMEREMEILGNIEQTPTPRVAMLAGAKVSDSLRIIDSLLSRDIVDHVLVGGLVANTMFVAGTSHPGPDTVADVDERGYTDHLEQARELLTRFDDRIELPVDVAVERDGRRVEVSTGQFPLNAGEVPRDVGHRTIESWGSIIDDTGTIFVNGPVGRFEDERFGEGTHRLFSKVGYAEMSIAGGGDTAAATRYFGLDGFDHVSTGGGAALAMLSGEVLPGINALEACTIEQPP